MKNLIISYFYTLICILLCCNLQLHAQYEGGNGDGAYKSSTIQITLNGSQINPLGLYRGGYGDGHDKKAAFTTLAGAELTNLYQGGNNDGNSKNAFQGTLEGADLTNLFLGGNGDGNDKFSYQGTLDGTLIEGLYLGGTGDGNDKFSFSGVLDGVELAQLYQGGEGDGHYKSQQILSLLDGEMLSQLYLGGNGDGHDKDFFSGVLDGSTLSGLYSGGIGDGFSKNMIQYIFDFPGCTFVVNKNDDGFGSLRYAIDCAAPGDTIEFSPLLQQESIVLTTGKIDIVKDLYVNGIKAAELTVDANQASRAFMTGANNITIKGLKIIVGSDPSGGAIQNNSLMTIMDVDIYDPTGNATSVIETTMSGSLTIRGTVTIQEN
ncbi:MAG: hypothetical protein ACJA1A_002733 [Saprospiraceae bacterium]|jgi:hypothetical protein